MKEVVTIDEQVKYWIDECFETFDTAKVLLEKKKYLDAAFFCHLSCEKMLKAAFVYHTFKVPPKTHSLNRLTKLAALDRKMTNEQIGFINRIEVFQIEGRYPQDRQKLLKFTPTEEFQAILMKTEEMILWIKQQIT